MNGSIKIGENWTELNNSTIIDINGQSGTLVVSKGDKFFLSILSQVPNIENGVLIWQGNMPTNKENIVGAEVLGENKRAYLVVGNDNIYVKSLYGESLLIVRKVQ